MQASRSSARRRSGGRRGRRRRSAAGDRGRAAHVRRRRDRDLHSSGGPLALARAQRRRRAQTASTSRSRTSWSTSSLTDTVRSDMSGPDPASRRPLIATGCAATSSVPRPLRVHVPNGVCHVTQRATDTRSSSSTRRPRHVRPAPGARREARRWKLHAYCHMTNHVHLLIQTPSRRCRSGCSSSRRQYVEEFNLRHGRRRRSRSGAVQGRPRRDAEHYLALPAVLRVQSGALPASATGPRTGRGAATRALEQLLETRARHQLRVGVGGSAASDMTGSDPDMAGADGGYRRRSGRRSRRRLRSAPPSTSP